MFYKKTIKTLFNELMKTKHYFNDEENFIINKINDTEKHVSQLEKRINTLSDYIQGPYTKQINQNFAEIQMQLKMTEPTKKLAKYYKQFETKKVKKCQK